MAHATRFQTVSLLALAIAGTLAAGQAHASGFQLKENSVKAMGRAFAGSASAAGDASVVVNNPAAMRQFDGTVIQGDVTVVDLNATFQGSGTDAFGRPLTGGNGGNAGGVTPIPAISVIKPLSGGLEYVTVGAMVSAPFGLKTEYENGWVGRYHALTSDVKIVDLTLSAAVDVSERLSLGLGLIGERAEVQLSKAVDFGSQICAPSAATGGLPPPFCLPLGSGTFGPQMNDGVVDVQGTSNGFGWIAGANLRPTDALSIGLSYRSQIKHDIQGDIAFIDVPAVLAGHPDPNVRSSVANGPGGAKLTTPSVATLSATWAVNDNLRLMGDVSRTGWSSLREVRIVRDNGAVVGLEPFHWKNTSFYSLGGEYDISPTLTLRAGVAYDETPTIDGERTPRLPDSDRTWYSIGATWNVSDALSFDAGYTRIVPGDSPINNPANSSSARLAGDYDASVNLFGISAQYRF